MPSSLSGALEVGTINVGHRRQREPPDHGAGLETGVYQAIVTCEACGTEYDGQTHFPAGSLAIVAEEGSSGPRVLGIVIGALLFIAIIGSVIAWRRGWLRIGPRKRQHEEPDSTAVVTVAAQLGQEKSPCHAPEFRYTLLARSPGTRRRKEVGGWKRALLRQR